MISADEAYSGLRPEILLLIAGMVIVGIAMEESGLATRATSGLVSAVEPFGPLFALALFYGVTLILTEILSNATVAVLLAPMAIALAESGCQCATISGGGHDGGECSLCNTIWLSNQRAGVSNRKICLHGLSAIWGSAERDHVGSRGICDQHIFPVLIPPNGWTNFSLLQINRPTR